MTPETAVHRNIQLSLAIALLFSLVSCDAPTPTQAVLLPSQQPRATLTIEPTATSFPTFTPIPIIELLTPTPPVVITPEKQQVDPNDKPQKLKPSLTPTPRFTEVPYPNNLRWIYGGELASEGNIYITVDDLAQEKPLAKMVKLFKTYGIRVTFFPNTNYIFNQDPQLWRDIALIGQIGYHLTDHANLEKNPKSMEELELDFAEFQKIILQKTGLPVEIARAPYGLWKNNFLELARRHNLLLAQWTAAPSDLNWDVVENKLKNNGKGGGILLFHATDKDADYLEANLPRLKALQFNGKPAQFPTINQVFR